MSTSTREVAIRRVGNRGGPALSPLFLTALLIAFCWVAPASAGNFVADSGFERGPGVGAWVEMSTNFGSPLCSEFTCSDGGGTGADTGNWWVWFGGILAFEEASVSQTVWLPETEEIELNFRLETSACSGDPADFLEVLIDGTQLFVVRGDDIGCDEIGYRDVRVDLSEQVTQNNFELEFHGIVQGNDPERVTNFFVDNIKLVVGGAGCPRLSVIGNCPGPVDIEVAGGIAGSTALLLRSFENGSTVLPGGPCSGLQLQIEGARPSAQLSFDETGTAAASFTALPDQCGLLLQAVNLDLCTPSNVTNLPE